MKLARTHARTHASGLTENTPRTVLLVAVVLLLFAPAAHAGIADTPRPIIPPNTKAAKLVFSIPWTINNASWATVITCTSLESTTFKVGIENFDSFGGLQNDVVGGDGVLDIAPGQTVSFTSSSVSLPTDQLVGSASNNGSARVVAYSTKLLCTAKMVSHTSPVIVNNLTIVKAKAQKGD